jgi:hypothetical protein
MDIVLDPRWLVDPDVMLPTLEGFKIHQVPVLELNPEGELAVKNDNLWVLSGNHRRLALAKYIQKMERDVEALREAIDEELYVDPGENNSNLETDIDANMDADNMNNVTMAQEKLKLLEEKIESSQMWTVRVYDRSQSSRHPYPIRIPNMTPIQARSRTIIGTTRTWSKPSFASFPETRPRAPSVLPKRNCFRRSSTSSRTSSSWTSPR